MPRLPGPFTANRKTCWLTVALVLCAGCRQQPPAAEQPPAAAATAAGDAAARGSSAPSDRLPQPAPVAQRTAEEILRQLVARCRAARSYQDQGVVRLAYRQGGQPVRQEWPCSVVWQRPNQLLVRAFQATVWCDGESLAAHIRDETTGDLDGQVLLRPAPAELQASDLTVDPLLDDILRGRVGRLPAMVELLLPSHGLLAALEEDVACRRLDDDTYDGRMCFRVEVASVQGPLVLWIDQQEGYLRRLDYSARHLLPELAADPSVSEIALFADLQQAQFDRPIATFQVIKHKAVDMLHRIELSRVGTHYAAWASGAEEPVRAEAAAMAKAYVPEAAVYVTGECIQIHGGVGFTWDCDAHLCYRKAKQDDLLFGYHGIHRERVADLVLARS